MRRLKKLFPVSSTDEELILIPFGFTINGTSNPDGFIGDNVTTFERNEAGEFTGTLRDRPPYVFCGFAEISSTADDVDITGKVDWSTVVSAGTFKVRCMTGSTQTDPTDNLKVGGVLICKKTTRVARGG